MTLLAKKIVSKKKPAGAIRRQLAGAVMMVAVNNDQPDSESMEEDESPSYTLVRPPAKRTSEW